MDFLEHYHKVQTLKTWKQRNSSLAVEIEAAERPDGAGDESINYAGRVDYTAADGWATGPHKSLVPVRVTLKTGLIEAAASAEQDKTRQDNAWERRRQDNAMFLFRVYDLITIIFIELTRQNVRKKTMGRTRPGSGMTRDPKGQWVHAPPKYSRDTEMSPEATRKYLHPTLEPYVPQ
ncbi:hypothetical protein PoB_005705900 [Plakobranchus ocellatus]|uniref:Uncharacterized protein n=1 Tax=Plakobranchus ocellatus TaxID=259542 RepID=A0AAV4CIA6_9GAST|nr:hypothetical protein PoB_005705900 [Plakobranchus ocellatus]